MIRERYGPKTQCYVRVKSSSSRSTCRTLFLAATRVTRNNVRSVTVGTPFERDAVSSARNVSRFGIRIGSLKLPLFLHSHAQVFIETLLFFFARRWSRNAQNSRGTRRHRELPRTSRASSYSLFALPGGSLMTLGLTCAELGVSKSTRY